MNCYENIPAELKKLNQWVCTRGNSKVPMKAWENEAASSTNPQTWADFDTAHKSVSDGHYDYCGFVFNDNGFVGVDIDTGYDEDGLLSPLAADIIGKCRSYTEKSKSGRGFHILLKGDLPFKGKNNLAGVEIYKSSRYFIMTGDTLLFRSIEENQSAIEYIVEKYFPETQREKDTAAYGGRIYCPIWEMPENNRIKLRPVYPRIPNGSRNICLTSLAGMLHNQGYSKQQIYDELLYCNTVACDPPLDRGEIQTMNIDNTMKELAEYIRMGEEIAANIDALKDALKQYMRETGVDSLTGTEHKASYKAVVSSRIDTTALKKDAPEIAAKYTRTTESRRFTFA